MITPADIAWNIVVWLFFFLLPLACVYILIYKVFSGPLRRRERMRLFFDLLEAGFRQGQRPEVVLVQAAQTNDRSLGKLFQQMAERLREGARLSEAVNKTPKLLPPQAAALIRVGEEIGDVRKILPAGRLLLHDASSQTRSGFNFLVIGNLILMPTVPIIILILNNVVFPKFLELFDSGPGMAPLVMQIGYWVAGTQLTLAALLWLCVWIYASGPRAYGAVRMDGSESPRAPFWQTPLWTFLGRPLAPLRDRILYAVPWRRRRRQRDFCAALSLLLDSDTPEATAVALAAEATASHVFIARARRALRDLSAGQTLQTALRRFDTAGEFSWRLANAAAQQGGFLPALAGWMEALEAKAFQQEQAASQLITSGLVLCNGAVVGSIVIGVFAILTSLMQ